MDYLVLRYKEVFPKSSPGEVGLVILGWTHFPFAETAFRKVFKNAKFVNPGELLSLSIKNSMGFFPSFSGLPKISFYLTDRPMSGILEQTLGAFGSCRVRVSYIQ